MFHLPKSNAHYDGKRSFALAPFWVGRCLLWLRVWGEQRKRSAPQDSRTIALPDTPVEDLRPVAGFTRRALGFGLRLSLSLVLVALLVVMAWLALYAGKAAAALPSSPATAVDAPVVPGELVLAVPPGLDRAQMEALAQRHGARLKRWVPRLGLALVATRVGGEMQTARALAAEPLVRFATEHRLLARVADIPLDEYWDRQWGMARVQGPAAWDLAWGDPAVVIAVLDTGVHLQHWDLMGQLWINPGESGLDPNTGLRTCAAQIAANLVDDDDNGYVDDCWGYDFVVDDNYPMDEHEYGHGTFVAGIAGAATNNPDPYLTTYQGVAGMGRQARLMALRVLDASGYGSAFNIAQAIDYATTNGAQIINLSLTFRPTIPPSSPDVQMLRLAVEAAQAADVLVIGASGNDDYNGVSFPARFPGVLAVGASRRDDTRAGFSNYGLRLDLVAPGVEIFSTLWRPGTHSYGYYRGSQSTSQGTSFAAPHVSGVAALVRALRPDLPQSAVYELVRRTADDVGDPGFDVYTGWGRLNARRAVEEAVIGLQLNLRAEPPTLPVGRLGTVHLAITAPTGGPAGLGARVLLSSSPGINVRAAAGEAGFVFPTVVTADSTGRAEAFFVADALPGTAYITASLGSVISSLPITITSGQPAALTLAAQPLAVANNGGQAVVTATVRDEGGSLVLDGIPVTFTATLGQVNPVTALTLDGQATTVFTAGSETGQAILIAQAGAVTATTSIAILGIGQPYTLTLAAHPAQIQLDGTPAVITATVIDALGDPVPDGIPVTFATDLGQLSATQVNTVGGRAVIQLAPGTVPGIAHVNARAGEAQGDLQVRILPGPAAVVVVTADPGELVANFNQVTQLTATVRDRHGHAVADGTEIRFETSLGQLISSSALTADGVARVLMLGGRVAGTAVVTATAPGGVQGTAEVVIRPNRPAAVELVASPEQIAVGGERSLLQATVRDAFGNLVEDSTPVTFTTNLGGVGAVGARLPFTGTVFVGMTFRGIAEAELVSGERTGVAEVGAAVNATTSQVRQVRFVAGPAAQLTLTVDPSRVFARGRVQLSAWVIDRFGNNVADGTAVNFGVTAGQLDAATAPTRNGLASTWLTAPDRPGMVQVAAISTPASAFAVIEVLPGEAVFLPLIVR